MKIDFIRLEFKNVLSYGNSPTVFEFKNGIDLINAKNGAGKSSFIDALTYGLYGKAFRKIKNSSLINHHNNKELLVKVVLSVENAGYYQIVRGMKPNVFEIYHNKKEPIFTDKNLVPQSATVKDYQDLLEEEILKMNENVYRQLIVLGANISTSKNFMDLTSKEKEEVFQIITDTSVFNDLRSLIKKKISLANTYVMEHEYKVSILATTLETEKRNIASMEQQNAIIKMDKETIISQLEDELSSCGSKVPEYDKAIQVLKELKEKYDEELNQLNVKKYETTEATTEHRKVLDELHHLHLAKQGAIECDKCSNVINRSGIDISEDRESQLNEMKVSLEATLTQLHTDIRDIEASVNAKKEKLLNSKRIGENRNQNLARIDQLGTEIESKRQWKELDIDYSYIHKLELELEDEKSIILSLKEEMNNLTTLNSIVGDDELKGYTLSQQIPLLNRYINQFIERFNAFEYNFVIDTSFKERIISRNEEKEFNAMSNGQKQRFTFSILFAFLKLVEEKNGITTNLLILDEVLDSSSDTEGKFELIKILTDDFSKSKNVIIISHNPDIVQNVEDFNRVIKVEHDNYSKLTVE
jgi:DNA repair exonuclease SbcCD ATPase subunit